ncbi:hypothetical protein E4T66_19775 [Sinimarinibacterium sp. CAU 1509]|uniref:hypothetical protein n=1 Tax=Sinimarinibacterium sp. CAU 1509 TaxID=2562283 RepID=UPI0010AC6B34|nr:hypothetical protein [Sinimarinibacterium sp. CAU 1509]TJY56205.1 hypothetical protein E4T66_19775 [Sinimarinibacterium sp. CAU 1509]
MSGPAGNDGEGVATAGKAVHPGDLYAHFAEHDAELKARYPEQFQGQNLGLRWPDGWHTLVAGVCAYVAEHGIPVRWHQIKEKFGELRMYAEGVALRAEFQSADGATSFTSAGEEGSVPAAPTLEAKIREAQTASLQTCSRCGATDPSAQVTRRVLAGWWFTACDRCVPDIHAYVALPRDQR